MFQRALVLRLEEVFLARIIHGEDHPEYAMSLYNAAWLYSKLKARETIPSFSLLANPFLSNRSFLSELFRLRKTLCSFGRRSWVRVIPTPFRPPKS